MMSSLSQNDSMGLEKLRSGAAVKPQPLENHELYHEDNPKKVAIFAAFVTKDFLGEYGTYTSPHYRQTHQSPFADAAAVGAGKIFVVSKNEERDEIKQDEEENKCFHPKIISNRAS